MGGLDYLSLISLQQSLGILKLMLKQGWLSMIQEVLLLLPIQPLLVLLALNSKMSYPDQSHSTTFTSASSSPTASSNVMELFSSFVVKTSNGKWQCSLLGLTDLKRKLGEDEFNTPRSCKENSWILKQDHEGEDVENGDAQVYGMIARAEEDATGTNFPCGCEHLYAELKKNVTIRSFGGHFLGSTHEVFDLFVLRIFGLSLRMVAEKPLFERLAKMLEECCSSPITGTCMPPSNNSDLDEFTRDKSSDFRGPTDFASGFQVSNENPHKNRDLGIVDSGCSRSMTGQ
ncbi:hypothetical protein Tco_0771408 [Tanacetum coccineum]|uniref:Uncharacterized protein n=1 Tax=Tanacetum coccineum TaxID=301880 RepID=A0ABQ4ZG06_9ASTR